MGEPELVDKTIVGPPVVQYFSALSSKILAHPRTKAPSGL